MKFKMTLLTIVRIFTLSIFFNTILPTGDIYSDIFLMVQTWSFQNTDSLEMNGCRSCFGKSEEDLYPNSNLSNMCLTKNFRVYCGGFVSTTNKLLEIEKRKKFENQKWVASMLSDVGNLTEGECDWSHLCCFEIRNNNSKIETKDKEKMKSLQIHPRFLVDCDVVVDNPIYDTCLLAGKVNGFDCAKYIVDPNIKEIKNFLKENNKNFTKANFKGIALKFFLNNDSSSDLRAIAPVDINNLNKDENFECGVFLKPKNVKIIGDGKGVDCGINTCKIHLDFLHYYIDGMHDLHSWRTKISYRSGSVRVGGRNCHLLRVYAWTMVIPILINIMFSGIIFYNDWRSGFSSKYEVPFLPLLLYPQWRTLKILMRYFTHKEEEKLTNELDKNDKEVSFIEPFCESGLQVLTSVCILFSTEAFFPKDAKGLGKTEMPLATVSLFLSFFTGSFGITKFFSKGPLPILPQDAPLAGLLSVKFFILFALNTMFVVRTFCIESAVFSSYRNRDKDLRLQTIDPLIPEEYRLVLYLLPGLISSLINIIKLALSIKPKDFRYFKIFPQFLLCPMFCPLMFEGDPDQNGDNRPPVKVWKLGSILNSFFMGCIPQIMLIALDHYRKVPDWDFEDLEGLGQDNNALLKYSNGNTIFSIATLSLYLCLTTIFFGWDKLFKDDGILCTFCKIICRRFRNPCSSPSSEASDKSTVNNEEIPQKDHEPAIESPTDNRQSIEIEERENLESTNVLSVNDKENPEHAIEQLIRDISFSDDIQVKEGEDKELEVSIPLMPIPGPTVSNQSPEASPSTSSLSPSLHSGQVKEQAEMQAE